MNDQDWLRRRMREGARGCVFTLAVVAVGLALIPVFA